MSDKITPLTLTSNPLDLLRDGELIALISAYLDGELTGDERAAFETRLQSDEALARHVNEFRDIERQLGLIGVEILEEPIPQELLDALGASVLQDNK